MLHFGESSTIEVWGGDIYAIASEEISWTLAASGSEDILIVLYREGFLDVDLMIECEREEIPECVGIAVKWRMENMWYHRPSRLFIRSDIIGDRTTIELLLFCSPQSIEVFISELVTTVYLLVHFTFECDIVHLTVYRREYVSEAFIEVFSVFSL
jgi:hypothetical protein